MEDSALSWRLEYQSVPPFAHGFEHAIRLVKNRTSAALVAQCRWQRGLMVDQNVSAFAHFEQISRRGF
jgi:hypothetical protein